MPGHWLFGNLLEFKRAPHEFLLRAGKTGEGLVQFRLLHKTIVAITSPDAAEQIFKTNSQNYPRGQQRKALEQVLGLGLITQEGAPWKRNRKIVAQAFRPEFLQYSLEQNSRLVSSLLDNWDAESSEPVDVVEQMRQITLSVIVRALFSIDLDLSQNQRLYEAIVNANLLMFRRHTSAISPPAWIPTPLNRALNETRRVMDEFIHEQLEKKRSQQREASQDIADHLLEEEVGGEINREQIHDEIRTLLVAGFETTATSLAWTLYLLARHPQIEQQWRDEICDVLQGKSVGWEDMKKLPITENIVMEALRLYPPAYGITRSATEESNFKGFRIPAGAAMVLSIYGIQRDSAYWSNPDEFDPTRFKDDWPQRAFIPFGLGKHICIGNRFSVLESMLVLACIGQKFQLSPADETEVKPEVGVTLLPDRAIRLRIKPVSSRP